MMMMSTTAVPSGLTESVKKTREVEIVAFLIFPIV